MKESEVPALQQAVKSPTKAEFANFSKFVKQLKDDGLSYAVVSFKVMFTYCLLAFIYIILYAFQLIIIDFN